VDSFSLYVYFFSLHKVTSTKFSTDTAISPADGHIVVRNM